MSIWEKIGLFFKAEKLWSAAKNATQKEHPTMDSKNILKSWVFWFNLLAGMYELADHAGYLKLIPAPYDALAIAAGNILLRFKTVQPVKLL